MPALFTNTETAPNFFSMSAIKLALAAASVTLTVAPQPLMPGLRRALLDIGCTTLGRRRTNNDRTLAPKL